MNQVPLQLRREAARLVVTGKATIKELAQREWAYTEGPARQVEAKAIHRWVEELGREFAPKPKPQPAEHPQLSAQGLYWLLQRLRMGAQMARLISVGHERVDGARVRLNRSQIERLARANGVRIAADERAASIEFGRDER